jgi:hypothetical protein
VSVPIVQSCAPFASASVPVHIDERRPRADHRLSGAIRALMAIVRRRWRT